MSVTNAILQVNEAVVWSDTKAFNADHRHVGYISKAVPIPHANVVFHARGSGDAFIAMMGQLYSTAGNTFDAIADTFETITARAWDEYFGRQKWVYDALGPDREYYGEVFKLEVGVVGYSHRSKKCKALILAYSGPDEKQRWDFEAVNTVLAPGITVPTYVQQMASIPEKMCEVANIQRDVIRDQAAAGGRPGIGAGGDLQAITIRPDGMHVETFATEHDGRFHLLQKGAGQAAPPTVPARPKVGRNVPCPCGSGRKAKHCCGA